jgi:hypothetical protein
MIIWCQNGIIDQGFFRWLHWMARRSLSFLKFLVTIAFCNSKNHIKKIKILHQEQINKLLRGKKVCDHPKVE